MSSSSSQPTLLSSFRSIFIYTLLTTSSIYILLALLAAVHHARPPLRFLLVILIAALLGAVTATALGLVPALVVAALYDAIPFPMPSFHALLWGVGQGLTISLLNAGAFHRLL